MLHTVLYFGGTVHGSVNNPASHYSKTKQNGVVDGRLQTVDINEIINQMDNKLHGDPSKTFVRLSVS
jgi:hypothetical protein